MFSSSTPSVTSPVSSFLTLLITNVLLWMDYEYFQCGTRWRGTTPPAIAVLDTAARGHPIRAWLSNTEESCALVYSLYSLYSSQGRKLWAIIIPKLDNNIFFSKFDRTGRMIVLWMSQTCGLHDDRSVQQAESCCFVSHCSGPPGALALKVNISEIRIAPR